MSQAKVGCSGFMYDHWKGPFYPQDLPKRRWFEFYQENFNTVELNVTFYRLPKRDTFHKWLRESLDGFSFSLKGSRFITHVKRLGDVEEPVERFFSLALLLQEKLSVVLWQFPPNFAEDMERLKRFLDLLAKYSVRQVFEFRNQSWTTPEVAGIIRDQGHALCSADWPTFLKNVPETTDFTYIRRHGHGGRWNSCYSNEDLAGDAGRCRANVEAGRDVFVYFNNDAHGYAPMNASTLKGLIKADASRP